MSEPWLSFALFGAFTVLSIGALLLAVRIMLRLRSETVAAVVWFSTCLGVLPALAVGLTFVVDRLGIG